MHKALFTAVLAWSATAAATPITDSNVFAGQPSASFDGIPNDGRMQFTVPLTVGGVTKTIATVVAAKGSETLIACDPPATLGATPDCYVTAWQSISAARQPVTITFDQPIGAFGMRLRKCGCGGYQAQVTESAGAAPSGPQLAGTACSDSFVGWAASPGQTITQIVLGDADLGTCTYGESVWDDLRVIPGASAQSGAADVSLAAPAPSKAQPGQMLTLPFSVANAGPDAASGVTVTLLLPDGVTQVMPAPAPLSPTVASFGPFDLANGAAMTQTLSFAAPARSGFDCVVPYSTAGVVGSGSADSAQGNNVAFTWFTLDRGSLPKTEICGNGIDDDCNGHTDCLDDACREKPECNPKSVLPPLPPPEILPPDSPWPPPFGPNPTYDPPPPPPPPADCVVSRNGMPAHVPSYCCDNGNVDIITYEANCLPVDPNGLTSDVHTDAQGYGFVAAGQTIHYTIDYENIGGADAHAVRVFLVLDGNLDDSTLAVGNGGTYDASSRTLTWIDPVVFPHDPRTVGFSAAVRGDAPIGTRVHGVATVIFPDAQPPSRIDTNFLEHVIPDPAHPTEPALAVTGCQPIAGQANAYRVQLSNYGYGYAYDVTATIVKPPPTVTVQRGSVSFADAIPAAATVTSSDAVQLTKKKPADACGALTWQLGYKDSRGQSRTAVVQAFVDRDRDGVPDKLEGAAARGCGCSVGAAPPKPSGVVALLAVLALVLLLIARGLLRALGGRARPRV